MKTCNNDRSHNGLNNPQTITAAIKIKMTNYVHQNKMSKIFKGLRTVCYGVLCGFFLMMPSVVIKGAHMAVTANDYSLLKFLAGFILVTKFSLLAKYIRKIRIETKKYRMKRAHPRNLIMGIPAEELVEYLIVNRHFKREGSNGVKQSFGLSIRRYSKLAETLEQNGILERGDNNSRILKNGWTRQSLLDYLVQNKEERIGNKWIRIVNHLATRPSKELI